MKQIHQYPEFSIEKKVSRIIFLTQELMELIYLFDGLKYRNKSYSFLCELEERSKDSSR